MSSEFDPAGSQGGGAPASGPDEPLVQPISAPDGATDATEDAGAAPPEEVEAPAPAAGAADGTDAQRAPARPMDSHNMLPPRERRSSSLERALVRLIATFGIIAIGVAIGAIMVSSKSQGWVVGLVVSAVSVVLAAILWSSRQL